MAPVGARFSLALSDVVLRPPVVPVMANATSRPHDAATIAERLIEQVRDLALRLLLLYGAVPPSAVTIA
jgi:hypothetical protein